MNGERGLAIFHKLQRLAEKFRDKIYRDGYVASHTRGVLAQQMRNFRGDLSQAEFAVTLDKQKTVIGRLESPSYSGWSLSTMLEVARKRNVAVFCRFVDFPTFLKLSDDLSDAALKPGPYDKDIVDHFAGYEIARQQLNRPRTLSLSTNWDTLVDNLVRVRNSSSIESAAPVTSATSGGGWVTISVGSTADGTFSLTTSYAQFDTTNVANTYTVAPLVEDAHVR